MVDTIDKDSSISIVNITELSSRIPFLLVWFRLQALRLV